MAAPQGPDHTSAPNSTDLGGPSELHKHPPFAISAQDIRLRGLSSPSITATEQAPLGILANLQETEFFGYGFNSIFRPDNTASPTPFNVTPDPLPPNLATGPNVLELNLTHEYLTFHKPLGSVPNRGANNQGDIFLNGLPYTQHVFDVTDNTTGQRLAEPNAIHFETGIWMHIPATTVDPVTPESLCRMASIPHGTTMNAQGVVQSEISTAPSIGPVSMTPSVCGTAHTPAQFPSQTATNQRTARLPQDLTPFIKACTITQAILENPSQLLTNALSTQVITDTITFSVSTDPSDSLDSGNVFTSGGGTVDINFLDGSIPAGSAQTAQLHNALVPKVTATFWIETVQTTLQIRAWTSGSPPMLIPAPGGDAQNVRPNFLVTPPQTVSQPTTITVTYKQLQYRQTVFLRFEGFLWPHVSVATLVPRWPIPWTTLD